MIKSTGKQTTESNQMVTDGGTAYDSIQIEGDEKIGSRKSLYLFLLGGIPIIASTLQAASALIGTDLVEPIPIVGTIAVILRDVDLFAAVANITFSQPYIVLVLFVLTALAWGVQGVAQFFEVTEDIGFLPANDNLALFAFGLSGILYGFISLIYFELFSTSLSMLEVGAFYAIPVSVVGCLYISYQLHPWELARRRDALRRIQKVQNEATERKSNFEREFENNTGISVRGYLDKGYNSPHPVDSVKNHIDLLNDLIEKARLAKNGENIVETDELQQQAAEIEGELEEMPTDFYDTNIDSRIRQALVSEVFEKSSNSFLKSRFGRKYNLHTEYSPPDVAFTVAVTNDQQAIKKQIESMIHNENNTIKHINVAVDNISEFINELETNLSTREDEFEPLYDKCISKFEKVESLIQDLDEPIGDVFHQYWIEDKGSETTSISELRETSTEALNIFHTEHTAVDPRNVPEDAEEKLQQAKNKAQQMLASVEAFKISILPGLERGNDEISPVRDLSEFDGVWTNELESAITGAIIEANEDIANIDLDFANGRVAVTYKDKTRVTNDKSVYSENNEGKNANEEVLTLINCIKTAYAKSDTGSHIEVSFDGESAATEPAVTALIEFLHSDKSRVHVTPESVEDRRIEIISNESNLDDGYINLVPEDDEPFSMAIINMEASYENWATNDTIQ